MNMTREEAGAIEVLTSNRVAWDIFMGYCERLLEFEKDQCVDIATEKVGIHQGRAKAFRQIIDLENVVTNRR